jgi:hypothetical protein
MNLKSIALAIHNYADVHGGQFPPAAVTDKAGRPLYSWRVAILPYLTDYSGLYSEFHVDEPWDSESNRKLLGKIPGVYRSRGGSVSDAPGMTFYQVFVGPGTAFERPGLTWKDFSDGPGSTFLVVEAAEEVPWTKPADLAYDPDGPLPKLGGRFTAPDVVWARRVISRRPVFGVILADGSYCDVPATTPQATLRLWIVRDAGVAKVDLR